MNLFAEWLSAPRGQWNDWLTQRVLEYPHAVQEAVRQEAEAYQRAWSREQDHTRQLDAIARWKQKQEAERLERQRQAEEYAAGYPNQGTTSLSGVTHHAQREEQRLERIRRIEEHSRQQLEAIRRRREEAEEQSRKQAQAWQALEKDGAEWHGLVKENWPYEMQPDCTGESYELGMIEDEVMA